MLKEVTWGFISPFFPQYEEIFPHGKLPIRNTLATFTLPSQWFAKCRSWDSAISISQLFILPKSLPSITQGENLQVGSRNVQFNSPPDDSNSALRPGTIALSESNSVPFDTLPGHQWSETIYMLVQVPRPRRGWLRNGNHSTNCAIKLHLKYYINSKDYVF